MTIIELIKKIEKLNKINKELDFEEKKLKVIVKDYLDYEVKTIKDLDKIIEEYEWEEEEKEVLNTKELKKIDSTEYELKETYYIGQYDCTMDLRIEIR